MDWFLFGMAMVTFLVFDDVITGRPHVWRFLLCNPRYVVQYQSRSSGKWSISVDSEPKLAACMRPAGWGYHWRLRRAKEQLNRSNVFLPFRIYDRWWGERYGQHRGATEGDRGNAYIGTCACGASAVSVAAGRAVCGACYSTGAGAGAGVTVDLGTYNFFGVTVEKCCVDAPGSLSIAHNDDIRCSPHCVVQSMLEMRCDSCGWHFVGTIDQLRRLWSPLEPVPSRDQYVGGYRAWRLWTTNGGGQLHALSYSHVWHPGRNDCREYSSSGSTAGFYGFHDIHDIHHQESELFAASRRRSGSVVIGSFVATGRVKVATRGIRCQQATPEYLVLPWLEPDNLPGVDSPYEVQRATQLAYSYGMQTIEYKDALELPIGLTPYTIPEMDAELHRMLDDPGGEHR